METHSRGFINRRRSQVVLILSCAFVYASLAFANAFTKSPEIDEGFFASPAFNLLTKGSMGTTILETSGSAKLAGSALVRLETHTYWIMPLHPLAQAGWYKIFGFGYLSMRGLSITFGLVALAAWFLIVRVLSGSREIALMTFALLSIDYTFVINAASGRMDMMSAAFGFSAYAAYLMLRARHLSLAVILSQSFIVLSGLTHPNGILHFCGLLFLSIYLDRKRISWRQMALAITPYAIGFVGWGLYIAQDPGAFLAQFGMNSTDGGRLSGLKAPWIGVLREFTVRYPHAFGLTSHSAGHFGPIYLKALILITYLVAFVLSILIPTIRKHVGYRALLIIVGIYFIILSLIDGQKETPYLIHLFPFYVALLAVVLHHFWINRIVSHRLLVGAMCALVVLQVAGLLYRAKQDTYHRLYLPTIRYLVSNSGPAAKITGTSSLGFGLGFDERLKDDILLGYESGKRPDFIVVGEEYEQSFEVDRIRKPEVYRYVLDLLGHQYEKVYENNGYKVYKRL